MSSVAENRTLRRLTGPAQRPVTLEQAKNTLRLSPSDTSHDADLTDAIDAAVEQVEQDTDRALINQSFQYARDCFPSGNGNIQLKQKPIVSVESINYLDPEDPTGGTILQVVPGDYALDIGGRIIFLVGEAVWPTVLPQHNAVTINYTCGYGLDPSEVPILFKRAVLIQVGRWFYDPAGEEPYSDEAYESIIQKLVRTSYY